MGEQPVEGEAVDERLQRRTGRAQHGCHVDGAAPRRVAPISAARTREDFAGVPVGDDRGDVDRPGQRIQLPPQSLLQGALQGSVDRGSDGSCWHLGHETFGEVRRQQRQGPAGRKRRSAIHGERRRRQQPGGNRPRENPIPGAAGTRRVAVGAVAARRLRQGDQQRRLGIAEHARLLAEPGQRAGPDALEVAAHRHQREVSAQDLGLAHARLELTRTEHLDQLGTQDSGTRLEQAHELHGERRTAGHDVSARRELAERADQRQRHRRLGGTRTACPRSRREGACSSARRSPDRRRSAIARPRSKRRATARHADPRRSPKARAASYPAGTADRAQRPFPRERRRRRSVRRRLAARLPSHDHGRTGGTRAGLTSSMPARASRVARRGIHVLDLRAGG